MILIARVLKVLRISRNSSVTTVTAYGLDTRRLVVPLLTAASGFFLHPMVQIGSGVHTLVLEGYYPGEKLPRRDIGRSLSSGIKVKNEWSYTSTPSCDFSAFTRTIFYLYVTRTK